MRTKRETSSVTASQAGPEPGVRKVLSSYHRGRGYVCITHLLPSRTVSVAQISGRLHTFSSPLQTDLILIIFLCNVFYEKNVHILCLAYIVAAQN